MIFSRGDTSRLAASVHAFNTFPFGLVPGPGGPGLLVDGSKVALQHCTVTGGAGGLDQVDRSRASRAATR